MRRGFSTIYACQGKRQNVASIEAGGFFGEVALVTHAPRAADCLAESERVKLLSLGRDAFERLMGALPFWPF